MRKKEKIQLEFVINSSPTILFNFLATSSGMSQWFADNVDHKDGVYTFVWNGSEEKAVLLEKVDEQLVRFRWEHDDPEYYFEFKIEKSEVTRDTILIVTDFVEEIDKDDQIQLWESQIKTLMLQIGS